MMADLSTVSLPPTSFGLDLGAENMTECVLFDAPPGTIYGITWLICLFGLVGNGIVLWFLSFHIKRNPFTVYILNLAVSDAFFLLCSTAYLIACVVEYPFCVNNVFIYIFLVFNMLCLLTYSTSLYLLTAISTERCLSVLYPFWYQCHQPEHLSAIVCALLWALFMLLSCTVGVFCLVLPGEYCIISFLPTCFLNVLIFAPIMVLSSLTLFIKVRCSSQQHQPGKLYAVILLTVLFFLLFTVPHSVQIFLLYHNIFDSSELFHMLASASSGINPFIYFLVGSYGKRQFRGSIKVALQRVFEQKTDSREDGETTSAEPMNTVT
ncbi:mas-related G-protein coupled receptor member H-like [Mauremys reevesii]|uniref:mas-related G-protein coupled receptor member H-like n=1 Tax=Mauremys reevesii TaxID=260615 RepID=UPI00193F80B1|nr:mas-related G-protein coupled receptor member H-like [Mauremys reevesii]XP_039373933.1 mas-related G-protein coupled receptor member H-like [Mauremys reevesii]